MKIYITRHGQTNNNIKEIFDGSNNIEINNTGIEQAKQVRDALKNKNIDLIFCSPKKRTIQTMEIINSNNIPYIIDNRIDERNCDALQGQPYSIMYDNFWNLANEKKYDQVETLKEIFNRVYDFLDEIKEKYADKTILIITHNGTSKPIRCYFEGIFENQDICNIGINNCEILEYEI